MFSTNFVYVKNKFEFFKKVKEGDICLSFDSFINIRVDASVLSVTRLGPVLPPGASHIFNQSFAHNFYCTSIKGGEEERERKKNYGGGEWAVFASVKLNER